MAGLDGVAQQHLHGNIFNTRRERSTDERGMNALQKHANNCASFCVGCQAGDANQATDTGAVKIIVDVLDMSVTSQIKNATKGREKFFTCTLRASFSLGMCVTTRAWIAFLSEGEISRP